MKQFKIIAYAEPDEGLNRQECLVNAKDSEDALRKGWNRFPEYHQVGAYEVKS